MEGGGEERWEGNEDFRRSSFRARHPTGKHKHVQKQEIVVTSS